MALIWEEKINGLLMTSAAANFPPAAPPRAGVSSSKLHRPRQGLLLTGHWRVRGERADIKIRKVHLCPPGTIASIQTKSLRADIGAEWRWEPQEGSGTVLCGWIRKLVGEHSVLGQDETFGEEVLKQEDPSPCERLWGAVFK